MKKEEGQDSIIQCGRKGCVEGLLFFKIHKTTRKGKHLIREVTQALVVVLEESICF